MHYKEDVQACSTVLRGKVFPTQLQRDWLCGNLPDGIKKTKCYQKLQRHPGMPNTGGMEEDRAGMLDAGRTEEDRDRGSLHLHCLSVLPLSLPPGCLPD